jgi:hypothetical protein
MSASGETAETATASRISRRNALKAGVAAGVGAAVWGGPQIGRIGSTPAYAAHCTPGEFVLSDFSDPKNTSWNCGTPALKYMNYKKDIDWSFANLLGVGVSPTFNNDTGCSDQNQTFWVTGVPVGTMCQPILTVFEMGGSNQQLVLEGDIATGEMPPLSNAMISGGTTGSWFIKAQLKCGPATCFHP